MNKEKTKVKVRGVGIYSHFMVLDGKNKTVFEIKSNGDVAYRNNGKLCIVKSEKDLAKAFRETLMFFIKGSSWDKRSKTNKLKL